MTNSNRSELTDGIRDVLPISLAVVFFAMLFGATGVSNGLTLPQTVLSSASVFAGASQFVFLDLYGQKAPVWSILLAVFAINFRHVLYSASIGRFLGTFSPMKKTVAFFLLCDPLFGAGEVRAEKHGLRPAYYFGFGGVLYVVWIGFTFVGGLFGKLIEDPEVFGFDMLLAVYFLSLLMGFRSRPNWLATVLASGIAAAFVYKFIGSPWHIMLGALVGIILAAILGKPDNNEPETINQDGTPVGGTPHG